MENPFNQQFRIRMTYGEILADGTIIDLLASPSADGLELILFDGKQSFILPQLEHGGFTYMPAYLDPSVRQAIRFPTGLSEYGTTLTLFTKVESLFPRHLGLAEDSAAFLTAWVFGSWLPEYFPAPPTLCVFAASMAAARRLFRLLSPLCRRALRVAELSRRLLISGLRPTLLVNDPRLSARSCASWQAANDHDVYVVGRRGALCNLASAKAVFCGPEDAAGSWGDDAMRLQLPPVDEFPLLSNQAQAQIAAEFQPQLERYRLVLLGSMPQSSSAPCPPEFANFELARNLFACLPDVPALARVVPLLECQQQELAARRSLDPRVAIVEALWTPAHEAREISSSEVRKRVNAILGSRGEVYEYNSKQVGWKLSKLELSRHRTGECNVVQFTSEIRRRIHQLAREFGLNLPRVEACPDCAGPEKIDE